MHDKDTFHTAAEFGKFPWHLITGERYSGNWAVCRTGGGCLQLPNATCFQIVAEDLSAAYWQMPEALVTLLEKERERAVKQTKMDIRFALGL